jgi:hypothetical protein
MDRVKGRGNAGLWTPRKTKGGFSTAPTGPWKSLRDSHIPTAPAGRGKVENQKQVSHFPTCCLYSQNEDSERRPGSGRFAPAFRLILQ